MTVFPDVHARPKERQLIRFTLVVLKEDVDFSIGQNKVIAQGRDVTRPDLDPVLAVLEVLFVDGLDVRNVGRSPPYLERNCSIVRLAARRTVGAILRDGNGNRHY